jgi:hypothetical protein
MSNRKKDRKKDHEEKRRGDVVRLALSTFVVSADDGLPSSNSPAGSATHRALEEQRLADAQEIFDSLQPSAKKALTQYWEALREEPGLEWETDRAVYNHVFSDVEDGEAISLATWTRYLRRARQALDIGKRKRRLFGEGRSTVRPEDI